MSTKTSKAVSKRIGLVDQTFRDGPQCLWASRMTTAMMLGTAEKMDRIGFDYLDVTGAGGNFDVAVRYLKENPWERLTLLRKHITNTPMMFVVRSKNDVGFKVVPSDISFLWIERFFAHGITHFRTNDPLQDLDNIVPMLKYAKEIGCYTVGALAFGYSPVHTDEMYEQKARELVQRANVDAIMIKDAGGLLTPDRIRTLVPAVRRGIGKTRLELHSHCMTGLCPLVYHEAVKLGVDQIHTAIPPLANGASQPAMQTMVRNLRGMGYTLDVDLDLADEVGEYYYRVAEQEGKPLGVPTEYDAFHFEHQIPGGMISNFRSQLAEMKMSNRLDEILHEAARVRGELGWPILITPFAQIVGTQAMLNVTTGERYKVIPDELKRYVLGYNGKLLAPVDPNVLDKIMQNGSGDIADVAHDPEPGVAGLRKKYPNISDEERLLRYSYAGSHVDDMLATGATKTDYLFHQPIARILEALAKRPKMARVFIQKKDLLIDMRS